MAKFQIIVSDTNTMDSQDTDLEGPEAQALIGKSIGEEVERKLLRNGSLTLRITEATDKDGMLMRFDNQGGDKKRAILS